MKFFLVFACALAINFTDALAVPPNVTPANPLQARYPDHCWHETMRVGTSAGLDRYIKYLESIGDRWCEVGNPDERALRVDMCTEKNHGRPDGRTYVTGYVMRDGSNTWGYEKSKCRDVAVALKPILKDCVNNNCLGKGYCGVGGSTYANGNGNIRLDLWGHGNW